MKERIIFHIDVNSAYLSWEAAYRLQKGITVDLRDVPSIVGGNPETRRGIVLAKSIPAKKAGIQTGETLHKALQKCPTLTIIPPNYSLYLGCSRAMVDILMEYSPDVQRFSIDECFVEFTDVMLLWKDYMAVACEIKDRIKNELGFTVSIGISTNKLLAKVASDMKKPDAITTLFPDEIPSKMWPLPVEDLYMVGRATTVNLHALGIYTIGELAAFDLDLLCYSLKKHGSIIWNYSHGIEDSTIQGESYSNIKGIGNSTTIPYDITTTADAYMYLLSLTEMVSMRLRDSGFACRLISVSIKNSGFTRYTHQKKLNYSTNNTTQIFKEVKKLFDDAWCNEPIRHLGVRVSEFEDEKSKQISFFDPKDFDKLGKLDKTIDDLRLRYGNTIITRGVFPHSGIKGINGGMPEEDFPVMTSIL